MADMSPEECLRVAERLLADARARMSEPRVEFPAASLEFAGEIVEAIRAAVLHIQPPPLMHRGMVVLREEQLCELLKVSPNTVRKIQKKDPTFPRRRNLVGDVNGWLSDEVEEWLRSRPVAERDKSDPRSPHWQAERPLGQKPVKRNKGGR